MPAPPRYSAVAILLHWAIALLVLALVGLGLYMTSLPPGSAAQFSLYQWHKSLGITVLLLTLARIAWRLSHPVPALPATLKPWERLAARGTHVGLYALMLAIPLTGWALVSASPWNLPTILYGVIPWPHLPVLSTLEDKAGAEAVLEQVHGLLAWSAVALVALHVAAALKHHFILKDDVLARMLPGRRRGEPA